MNRARAKAGGTLGEVAGEGWGDVTSITDFGSFTDLVIALFRSFFFLSCKHFQAEYFFTPMTTDFPRITKPGRLLRSPTPKKKK